jgi:hypothetical protein
VLGVVVAGKSRAYLLKALSPETNHVVNDMIQGKPVSVTYCNRTGCARVFTRDSPEPLDLGVGGYCEGLLLHVDGELYDQITGRAVSGDQDIPFSTLPHEVTVWGDWRKDHPETGIYIGG